jgi:hypothetical protein
MKFHRLKKIKLYVIIFIFCLIYFWCLSYLSRKLPYIYGILYPSLNSLVFIFTPLIVLNKKSRFKKTILSLVLLFLNSSILWCQEYVSTIFLNRGNVILTLLYYGIIQIISSLLITLGTTSIIEKKHPIKLSKRIYMFSAIYSLFSLFVQEILFVLPLSEFTMNASFLLKNGYVKSLIIVIFIFILNLDKPTSDTN